MKVKQPLLLIILLPCILIAALCIGLCGQSSAPVACFGTSAPQKAVTGFFDSLCSGNYADADKYVSDYSGLGLDGSPETAFEKNVFAALKKSYSYRLVGELRMNEKQDGYVQTVEFTHIDISALSNEINEIAQNNLVAMTQNLSKDEIYGEDGEYRPELVDKVLEAALEQLLAEQERFCTTDTIEVELKNSSNKWRIVVTDKLADAILGKSDVPEEIVPEETEVQQ